MNTFSMLHPSAFRKNLKVMTIVLTWLMRLLSASVEVYLRNNFGQRYFPMLLLAFLFSAFCSGLIPHESALPSFFLFGQMALIIWHAVAAFGHGTVPPPHSRSTGESWPFWQRLHLRPVIVRCFAEPMLCLVVGHCILFIDQPLGVWLKLSGWALFIKESLTKIQLAWRILDAADAKLDAQQLNAGLNNYTNRVKPGGQHPHRAQFPHQMNQP